MKTFIIPVAGGTLKRDFEVKTMQLVGTYIILAVHLAGSERRVEGSEAHYIKSAEKLDVTFASGNNSNPFVTVYRL